MTHTLAHTDTHTHTTERHIDSETELMLTRGKKIGGGIDWEFGVDMYMLLYLK